MEFKFKHNGMTLRARLKAPGERITPKTLQHYAGDYESTISTDVTWYPSKHVGDLVRDHENRWYIEVMSPAYKGESTDERMES